MPHACAVLHTLPFIRANRRYISIHPVWVANPEQMSLSAGGKNSKGEREGEREKVNVFLFFISFSGFVFISTGFLSIAAVVMHYPKQSTVKTFRPSNSALSQRVAICDTELSSVTSNTVN